MHRALLIISVLSILILSCGNDLLNVELSEREIEIIQDCKTNTITSIEKRDQAYHLTTLFKA